MSRLSLLGNLLKTFIKSVKPDRLNIACKVGALRSFDFAQDDILKSAVCLFLQAKAAFHTPPLL